MNTAPPLKSQFSKKWIEILNIKINILNDLSKSLNINLEQLIKDELPIGLNFKEYWNISVMS
jgi:hypothetical protein